MERSFGVLMPLSSLPGDFGIGTMGKDARGFADALKKSGARYWQFLPLNHPGPGDSPYQSASAFAGSWYYIDMDELFAGGLLTRRELENARDMFPKSGEADYALLSEKKLRLLYPVFARAGKALEDEAEQFGQDNPWTQGYCRFMARTQGGEPGFYLLLQALFHRQWTALRAYCAAAGLKLIGDMPIYVAPGGAEHAERPELFDQNGEVAGCPPDAFSDTGQHWGNPVYDWAVMKRDGYGWWIRRFAHEFSRFDLVRIDHFRGFEQYCSIPQNAETAAEGRWKHGPGADFFDMLRSWFGSLPVIAEDLGMLTPSFFEFMARCGFPGINVLQFAFAPGANSAYLPHNTAPGRVVYTGTHDNDTTLGWYRGLDLEEREFLNDYLGGEVSGKNIADRLIRLAFSTVAELAVVPMQDILGLGGSARMNTPGTQAGNWRWRMEPGAFDGGLIEYLAKLARTYTRYRP